MRVLLVVCLLVTVAYADFQFTGAIKAGSPSFFPAGSGTPCTPTTTAYYYQAANHTFATAGVREIQADGYSSSYYIYVFKGSINTANGCENLVPFSDYRYLSGNQADDGFLKYHASIYLEANTNYIFVVSTSSTPGDSYTFGVNVIDANATASVNEFSPVWRQPYLTSSSSPPSFYGNASFARYTFTAAVDGHYDIGAFSYTALNASNDASPDLYIALFPGNPTDNEVYYNTTAWFRKHDYNEGNFIYYVQLSAGQQYTVIASDDNNKYSTFGFFVRWTNIIILTPGNKLTGIFTQPERTRAAATCSADNDYEGTAYGLRVFEAQGTIAIGVIGDSKRYNEYTANTIVGIDFVSYLYSTSNTIPVACPVALQRNPLADYEDSGPVENQNANYNTHTLVVAPWFTSTAIPSYTGFLAFVFGGPTIGATGPSTTGSATTGAATSGAATTSQTTGATSGRVTTGGSTGNATTTVRPTTTTTSAASQVVAHIFALVALFLVLAL